MMHSSTFLRENSAIYQPRPSGSALGQSLKPFDFIFSDYWRTAMTTQQMSMDKHIITLSVLQIWTLNPSIKFRATGSKRLKFSKLTKKPQKMETNAVSDLTQCVYFYRCGLAHCFNCSESTVLNLLPSLWARHQILNSCYSVFQASGNAQLFYPLVRSVHPQMNLILMNFSLLYL